MKDQLWAILLEYLWTPLVAAFLYLWSQVHKTDKRIHACELQLTTITAGIDEARQGREKIRTEQREDFKEIRELIAGMK